MCYLLDNQHSRYQTDSKNKTKHDREEVSSMPVPLRESFVMQIFEKAGNMIIRLKYSRL